MDSSSLLSLLFAPHSAEEFFSQHWPGKPLVAHGPLERLAPLIHARALRNIESVVECYGHPVLVALADKRDEHSVLQVPPQEASAHHAQGLALIFDQLHRYVPEALEWLVRLQGELGLGRCEARCILYATPRGGGNSPHFDANANFVIQLRGTKRWHLADNHHIRNPVDRWAINQGELFNGIPMPSRMPDGETVELKPGSVLFVPRGCWHATEADEESIALNLTYSQPTWADVVCEALHRKLQDNEAWRALADGMVAQDLQRAHSCRVRLSSLLHHLQAEVAGLEASEVMAMESERR